MPHRIAITLRRLIPALSLVTGITACSPSGENSRIVQEGDASSSAGERGDPQQLFTLLPSRVTGVHFENRLVETRDLNVFTYRNFYNGGGVGIGDLTGDGLPEIVLTSNQDGPRLFLNEGHFHFRDITGPAGLESRKGSWTTGVALADVNGDGRLDIYLCRAGPGEPGERANQLWINQGLNDQGIPTFKEMAKEYGVADEGYSTQAAFLDYDRDGDLDLLVVNNSPRPVSSFGLRNTRSIHDAYGGEKLYRNDGGGHFTEVGVQAGIHSPEIAFGLGVVVADLNQDGWPDIYVSNDFFERDYLYLNNHDGSFTDVLDREMPVVSYFSMGLDAADVDNDGWPDVYTTDMLPSDEYRLKTTSAFEGWDVYQAKVRNGYHYQLMRNMLQRNNRDGTFSDVGQLAGVSRTDWSWGALIADLDLDGRKDIFVTNGIARDITSQDYVAFLANDQTLKDATNGGRSRADFLKLTKATTSTPIPNAAFHNVSGGGARQAAAGPGRGLHFEEAAAAWGLATPSFSSGAAYGDLDGDGAPDLVVNNVDAEAFVYRNNARTAHPQNHYLQVRLAGAGANRFGVGARVVLYAGSDTLMQEQSPTRGFQSSVDYTLDFGLGAHDTVDSLVVAWPGGAGHASTMRGVRADQVLTIREVDAVPAAALPGAAPRAAHPALVPAGSTLPFRHHENAFVDFDRERLMPKLVSTEGPYLAVADVNGDGLEDVYIGGAKNQPGALLLQRRDGSFVRADEALFARDSTSEDLGAVFFDANGDGRPDLYVVSGGNEYSAGAPALQDRLYLNDGHGRFHKAEGYLPAETVSGSRVVAADYDGDGDIDLFVGGRVVPWGYGTNPQSMLLRNDGTGHFTDVTARLAPELARVGMVTDAVWRDVDGDGRPDLVVVGEWMPITVFHNAGGGRLTRLQVPGLEQSNGWWNRIVAGDFNGDGRVDFVLGNLGLNGRLHASATEPLTMYVKDFDGNGSTEQIISMYNQGVSYPLPLRDDLLRTLPYLGPRFLDYKAYARERVTDIFTPAELSGALLKTTYTFATTLALNDGHGSFTLVPLPDEAQLAPVYGILAADVDHDGHTDLLIGGNFDGFRPEIGRMAASYGLLLRGDGRGGFSPVRAPESGFLVPGQTRDIARVRTREGALIIVARNDDTPLLFREAPAREIARRARPAPS
ncbi:MAG TPA: VCBS repeat-containing protein, partial [Gemmatimonadaceae bacterium]|nr:VCBS repeat-containing protein [Gemmatimonadaceae bacterium]